MSEITLTGVGDGAATLAPVHLRNAGEHVADRLVTAIALGEYITGQRLPSERELAALLAVNRSSVREALHRLPRPGYVEIRRGRHGGAFVQVCVGPESEARVQRTLATDWAAFEELFDLRRLIEPVIAATAAERHDARPRRPRSARRTRPTSTPTTTARPRAPPTRRCISPSRPRRATATSSTSPSRSARA